MGIEWAKPTKFPDLQELPCLDGSFFLPSFLAPRGTLAPYVHRHDDEQTL